MVLIISKKKKKVMSSGEKHFYIALFMISIRVMHVNSFRCKGMQIVINKLLTALLPETSISQNS